MVKWGRRKYLCVSNCINQAPSFSVLHQPQKPYGFIFFVVLYSIKCYNSYDGGRFYTHESPRTQMVRECSSVGYKFTLMTAEDSPVMG